MLTRNEYRHGYTYNRQEHGFFPSKPGIGKGRQPIQKKSFTEVLIEEWIAKLSIRPHLIVDDR